MGAFPSARAVDVHGVRGPSWSQESCPPLISMSVSCFEFELLSVLLLGFSLNFLLVLIEADNCYKDIRLVTLPIKLPLSHFFFDALLPECVKEKRVLLTFSRAPHTSHPVISVLPESKNLPYLRLFPYVFALSEFCCVF